MCQKSKCGKYRGRATQCACVPSSPCPFCDNHNRCGAEVTVPHTPSALTAADPQSNTSRHNKQRGE